MSSAAIQQGSGPAYLKPVSSGSAIIALGAAFVDVANTGVTANSMIIVCNRTLDATANLFAIDHIVPGTSFRIQTNANATGACVVNWWILAY